jgi:hypothetical protein
MATKSTEESSDTSGAKLEVKKDLTSETRAISSVNQGISVCRKLIEDAKTLIDNAAVTTAHINGKRPRNIRDDANKAKSHKSNVNTGALATVCSKIPPRFYMPIKTSKYLVAGALSASIEGAISKTEFFREKVTKRIRRWKKWHFFMQGLSTEVGLNGYAFPCFFDEYDWKPKLIRQDKGFIPIGTELLDSDVPFFAVKWNYRPDELLSLARAAADKGKTTWKKGAIRKAVEDAAPLDKHTGPGNSRTQEDLIRQASTASSFVKGAKQIPTFHLFAKESTGKISHTIYLDTGSGDTGHDDDNDSRLLYEKLDRFSCMDDITSAMVFQFGNGTIHGSLGAGHILFDMSIQVELTRNESFDNLKMSNKLKLQVADGKDINMVKATVLDEKVIVSGATYAGANAALPVSVEGFISLDQQMTRLMEEKVGAFLPPAVIPGTSPTATQINVQTAREEEIRNAMLDNWLTQIAQLTYMMAKRLCNPKSHHEEAVALLKELKDRLSDEEIKELVEDCALQNILEFTEIVSQRRAQFAITVRGNQYYDQAEVERLICESAVGTLLTQSLMPAKQDQSVVDQAKRQQLLENSALVDKQDVPVVGIDNDYVHMETMKQPLVLAIQSGSVEVAQLGLKHYQAHYDQWIKKKGEPKDQKNAEKKFIRSLELALESAQKKAQQQAQLQQMQTGQPAGPVDPTQMPPEAPALPVGPEQIPTAA